MSENETVTNAVPAGAESGLADRRQAAIEAAQKSIAAEKAKDAIDDIAAE